MRILTQGARTPLGIDSLPLRITDPEKEEARPSDLIIRRTFARVIREVARSRSLGFIPRLGASYPPSISYPSRADALAMALLYESTRRIFELRYLEFST